MDSTTKGSAASFSAEKSQLCALMAFYEGLIDGPKLRKSVRRWLASDNQLDFAQFFLDSGWISREEHDVLLDRVTESLPLEFSASDAIDVESYREDSRAALNESRGFSFASNSELPDPPSSVPVELDVAKGTLDGGSGSSELDAKLKPRLSLSAARESSR